MIIDFQSQLSLNADSRSVFDIDQDVCQNIIGQDAAGNFFEDIVNNNEQSKGKRRRLSDDGIVSQSSALIAAAPEAFRFCYDSDIDEVKVTKKQNRISSKVEDELDLNHKSV